MLPKLIGIHPAIRDIRRALFAYAQSPFHVVILGEPGTGKSLIAEYIHELSPRKATPLRSLNFALLNERDQLILLFGAELPEINSPRQGALEVPTTVILKNIHKALPHIQKRLAEAATKKEFTRTDAGKTYPFLCRLIVTTALTQLRGPSVTDLTPELKMFLRRLPKLVLPPLKERTEDIPLLAAHFRKHCLKLPDPALPPDDELLSPEFLKEYPWCENVRELKACLRSAIRLSNVQLLRQKERLEFEKMIMQMEEGEEFSVRGGLGLIENEIIRKVLERSGGKLVLAAKLVGMTTMGVLKKRQKQQNAKTRGPVPGRS